MKKRYAAVLSALFGLLVISSNIGPAFATDDEDAVLSVFGYLPAGSDAFSAATHIALRECEIEDYSAFEHFSYSVLTKDDTIDIYCFPSHAGLGYLKQKGFCVDLRESDVLKEASQWMYPAVLAGMTGANGALAAWPLSVSPVYQVKDWNADLLQEYGLAYPETFSALLDMLPGIVDSNILTDNNLALSDVVQFNRLDILNYYLKEYVRQKLQAGLPLAFDTDSFLPMVRRILTEVPVEDPSGAQGDMDVLFCFSMMTEFINTRVGTVPRVDEKVPACLETYTDVAVINPYSKHKEEALAYLEYLATNRQPYDYTIYSDLTEPVKNPKLEEQIQDLQTEIAEMEALAAEQGPEEYRGEIEGLVSSIEYLQENCWWITEEDVAHYQQMAPFLYIDQDLGFAFDDAVKGLVQRVVNGQITPEEFAEKLNQRPGR